MRIAVTYENAKVFQHFGHTEQFKIYDVEDKNIISETIIDTTGGGHGALADFLKKQHIDVLICGGIGLGARKALEEVSIKLYGGVQGCADDAVKALISGSIVYNPDVKCEHHGHNEDGNDRCHEHSCGENKNGCVGNESPCQDTIIF